MMFVVSAAVAIEPSNIVVTVNGKTYYKHIVEKGQTLYSIAKTYHVTEEQILDSNVGLTPDGLKADEYILVPRVALDSGVHKAASNTSQDIDTKKFLVHKVVKGDTLYSIARKYKISIAQIERDNPNVDIDHLAIDDVILIRRAERGYATSDEIERELKGRAERKEEPLKEGEHRVAVGETVYSLSRAYGLSEDEFMAINGLSSYNDLKVGMIVRSKTEASARQSVFITPPVPSFLPISAQRTRRLRFWAATAPLPAWL